MWGKGLRGNNATCLALVPLLVSSLVTHRQIVPFWCWFLGGWVCVCSRTLWVSPMNSPMRLRVSPSSATPINFYCQRFWGSLSSLWNPGSRGLSHSLVVPVYPHTNVGPPTPPADALRQVLSTWLPGSAPPTGLDECFFFNSLVIRLPYSSIFCHFWLFLFLNLLLSFFWLCEKAPCIYLCFHLDQKSAVVIFYLTI